MEEALEASVEVGMERAMSGFFPENSKRNVRRLAGRRESYEERTKGDRDLWAGKGLALNAKGEIPKGNEAILLAFKEFASGALRGGTTAVCLKGTMAIVFSLLRGNMNVFKAFKESLGKDTRKFAMFLSTLIGGFRALNVLFTCQSGKDCPENAMKAGALASLSILLDDSSRRLSISLYLFSRSLDVLVKRLVREGKLPYWKYFETFLFGFANVPIMYGFLFEPDILQKGYYNWILNMGDVTHDGLGETLRVRRDEYFQHGRKIPFRPCNSGYHEGSCLKHSTGDWFRGLIRAGKIYLPVHFIPLLLFRYKALLRDPSEALFKTSIALLRSCCFLTTYVLCIKGTNCFLRNLFKRDATWHALLAGQLTSFACLFEKPSRVSELTLYCLPRAAEATWTYLLRRGSVKSIKYSETLLFTAAMAVLLSGSRADFKPTYHRSLCFLIGSKVEREPKERRQTPTEQVANA